ncbi:MULTISPECIES: PAS domain S-box protein [unclassified Mucilaginibacter]|uniref:PAS domain S-box protein n=1 Tax=unclassified Mucilaginibacter TaxID=2617802 RepID=UPI002AC92155|nr:MULTISPECIES: PAS domain S-box protein [unclassified Mucilaginibacter]MEB0277814.1 PAS domain S-box protein [Mucilaginibacter sp. 10B2]MEB0302425.1 PAS domain S-box protein [Mucilaginibacter sp. 5C4]WPX22707.1 PAS domain S-box protein [Mucilaginibacter sp. 5C4]
MSFKNRALLLVENDITIYRLILLGLLIASPALHYLCFDNSYDPLWLRAINCAFCLVTLGLSYSKNEGLFKAMVYTTICSFLFINNFVLLSVNGFSHVYVFSSITIFIALSLFCKQRREFVSISLVNFVAVVAAYYTAPEVAISVNILMILLCIFTVIAYVSFLVMLAYKMQFTKAVNNIIQLNESLLTNTEKLRNSQQQMHALISSVNDTIFEFDENRICINVWFGPNSPDYLTVDAFLNKTIIEAIGPERAKPFDEVYEDVMRFQKTTTVEFQSVYGEPGWFVAKASPVLDVHGNYTKRISVSVTDISEQKKHADALIENKNLLLQAQDIAKTGNWWYDDETKEIYWSESLFKILEVEEAPEDLSRFEYYMGMVHPDDREFAVNYFTNINSVSENSLEHKFITPQGNLKYLRILRGEVSQNEDGSLKRVVGIIQDITESKLAEKAVKVSQAELIEAQTIAKIGNWKYDSNTHMLSWSDEVNSIYEVENQDGSASRFGRMLLNQIHPDDKYIVKHLFKSGDSSGSSYEYRIITPSGTIKHISVITGKLMYREDGSVRKIIGTLQDITQRKQAEIDYRRTENKYRLVLETIKLAAVSLNADGKVIFCNKYLANLLGYSQMEILGMDWIERFVPDEHQDILTIWFKTNSIRAHYVTPVICRDGELRTISWQNTVSYDENGNIKETTSIGEDITVQQKVRQELISAKEQAERSSHFKSEFLSIMSHEIRTPMNAVIGTTNLLLEENPKPEQLEYLNTLKFSSESLLAIINDILDYNKIEAGKLQLSNIPFNIHQLAQNIRQSFYAKAVEKNLDIELIADETIPDFLMGDQIRLGQILINLVSNAVKFTHEGKVSIILENEQLNSDEVSIKFTINDTGIGIAAENMAIVFDPFIQGPQTITHNYGGTGLGLTITKRLIELYESSIHVFSELGKGTRFTFSIRFKIAAPVTEPEHTNAIADIVLPPNLNGMNILVVDDNKMNLMIASKFLKKWQAKVDEAMNGQIAVDMVNAGNYDIVIMDLQMPVMDGFEATRVIKLSYPNLPVIAFTADAMPETHSKAYEAGMCDYLTKPFAPDTLFEKVSKHRKLVIPADDLSGI